jgi:serine/threonine-protein kinase
VTREPDRPTTAAERWRRVESVLGQALEAPLDQRAEMLDRLCGGDAELRGEVEELLAAEASAPAFLDDSAARFAASSMDLPATEIPGIEPGARVGEYRLLREIGTGGMSRVFLAERTKEEFEQRVAVKILRAVALDAAQGLERFRFERLILASLDHPHIARILDGGTTAVGLPYLVMEYVEGAPITRYCAESGSGLEQRLGLARDVCEAVQYAHQRLIVHRDLKPSNILVTHEGQVKLLDFGIAKLLDPEALDFGSAAPMTRTGLLLMTPDYAAPEQIRGGELTTASDVYSLGVLLYELLAGERPYRTEGSSPGTIERLVCETDPPPPSSAGLGEHGDAVPWRRALRGDLDAVVLKALRKEPEERYGSARELAADLESYLEGLPVSAGPTTLVYRAKKFVRRHRLPVLGGALFVVSLIGFGAVTAWQQSRTIRERDRARAAEAKASAINRFLVEDLLSSASPEVAQGSEVTVQEVVERATKRVEGSFASQPELEASVRRALGEIHLGLGELGPAEGELARAEELFRAELGGKHPETLETQRLRAELALAREGPEAALEDLEAVLEAQRREFGVGDLRALETEGVLADALIQAGEYASAVERLKSALETLERESPDAWRQRLPLLALLAQANTRQRRWSEAEAVATRALRLQLQHLGPNHPDVGTTLVVLGSAQTKSRRYTDAEQNLLRALELQTRVVGASHPDTLGTLRELAVHYWDREDAETATVYAREQHQLTVEIYGENHPKSIRTMGMVALLQARAGRDDLALPIYRRLVEVNAESLGPSHPSTIRALKNLEKMLRRMGRRQEARAVMERTLAVSRQHLETAQEDQTFLNDFAYLLANCEPAELRRPEEALPLAERAVELSSRQWDDALDTLARVYRALGRTDEAIATQREALQLPDASGSRTYEALLVEMLVERGELESAEEALLENLARRRLVRQEDDPLIAASYRHLGRVRAAMGRWEEAESDLRQAAEIVEKFYDAKSLYVWRVRSELGGLLAHRGRLAEAEEMLVAAANAAEDQYFFDVDAEERARAFERVVELYSALEEPELARDWGERGRAHPAW